MGASQTIKNALDTAGRRLKTKRVPSCLLGIQQNAAIPFKGMARFYIFWPFSIKIPIFKLRMAFSYHKSICKEEGGVYPHGKKAVSSSG